jgi:hypothetical protein
MHPVQTMKEHHQFFNTKSILHSVQYFKIALFIFYTSNNTVSKVKITFHDFVHVLVIRHETFRISSMLGIKYNFVFHT